LPAAILRTGRRSFVRVGEKRGFRPQRQCDALT
jgi:hypothetical protein